MLEDGKKMSENANPEGLISSLNFSRNVAEVSAKAKEKKVCRGCGKTGKMVCYNCGECLLEKGVLPQITLPFRLYVYHLFIIV